MAPEILSILGSLVDSLVGAWATVAAARIMAAPTPAPAVVVVVVIMDD